MHHRDSPRHWPLQGASNFRDLGGYPGHGGRPLRWRRLFRSDHLGGLTDADRVALRQAGITRALDFRGVDERAATPYHVPGLQQHSLAIEPTVVQHMHTLLEQGQGLTADDTRRLMQDLYRSMALQSAPRFAEFFQHVLDNEQALVFHCTAGKDRTGFAAALLLLALGVPRDQVLQDYLLTNDLYRHPPLPDSVFPREALAVLWRVEASFINAALQAIDEQGGVERYLATQMRLTPGAIKELARRYLQDA